MRNTICFASLVFLATTVELSSQDLELERRVDNTIREIGTVESAKVSVIRSPIESKILSIIEEGKIVKKGDLLATLEAPVINQQMNQLSTQKAQLVAQTAEAKMRFENAQNESQAELAFLESAANVAKLKLDRFTAKGGELSIQIKEAEAEVSIAEMRFDGLKKLVEMTKLQIKEAITSPMSLVEQQLALFEAEKQLEIAKSERELIEKHVAPHETALRELEVHSAKLALNKAKRQHRSQLQLIESELKAAEVAQIKIEEQVARLEVQKSRGKIIAPQAGIVTYENQLSARTSRDNAIQVGSQVRENQNLMRVADLEKLQLNVAVHESRIARVRVGQPVSIRVDAFPQRVFKGEVLEISKTAEQASWPNTSRKDVAVTVSITDPPDSLRVGLTALAEIDASK